MCSWRIMNSCQTDSCKLEEHMDAIWIVTVFEIIDTLMVQLDHHSHPLAHVPDSEVLTVAIVAAKYFQNHHERALVIMQATHHLSGTLSTSRFNRRLHALADWLAFVSETLGEVLTTGEVFVIDSLPLPVCKRARAPLWQGARAALLWLLCRQRGEVLRLAAASDLHACRGAGTLYAAAGRLARPDAAPRVDGRLARGGAALWGQGLQQRR
jgi:hypothetical protein